MAKHTVDLPVGRIHVLTVNNCPYCGSQQNQPHISKDCPGDFPQRYKELLAEIRELKKRIESLEQSEILVLRSQPWRGNLVLQSGQFEMQLRWANYPLSARAESGWFD